MDLRAAGPTPGRRGGRVRAAVTRPKASPAAIPGSTAELIIGLRKELAGRGLDAGSDTIARHLAHYHQVKVSAATISRYLAWARLVTPSRPSARNRLRTGEGGSVMTRDDATPAAAEDRVISAP